MMRLKSHILRFSILLMFALPAAPAIAQVDDKEKARQEIEKRAELERKTVALIDEIVAGAWGLKLPENRSFVLVNAADLIWSRDDKRARGLFWEALNSLNLPAAKPVENPAKSAPKGPTKEQVDLKRYYEVFQKRREFLRHVARRDPQLALDMLHATQQVPPKVPADNGFQPPGDTELEQEIADAAAVNDPKRALQIARETLSRGLTYQAGNFLFQLMQKDQNAATEFAGDIIAKLNSASLDTLDGPIVLTQLLSLSRTNGSAVLTDRPAVNTMTPLKLSDDQKRSLVEIIADGALSASAKPFVLQTARSVMPEIEQFAPDRAARIRMKLAESRGQNREQREWNTYDALFEEGTPEEMIKAGHSMGEERQQAIYREAVMKAVMGGRGDSFRDFINSQFEDGGQRNELIDLLDEQQVGMAALRGKEEELRKLLPLIRLKEQRALAMAELSIQLEKKGLHDEAVELLEGARSLVKFDLTDYQKSNSLLAFLLAYAIVDPNKAFAIIEPFVDKTNDSVSKLLMLDKVVRSGIVKNGEIILEQPGMPLDFGYFKYGRGVAALAEADFNRTKALADRFERNELKLMARVLLAQAILRNAQVKKNAEVPKGDD